ncbi:hypothetical protein ORL98_00480, partial [Bacillus cereus]
KKSRNMIVNKVDVNKNSLKTILLFFTASPLMRNTVNDFFIPLNPIGSTNNQWGMEKTSTD